MNTLKESQIVPDDITFRLNLKLSSIWASFMFFSIYVDYYHLYMPGTLKDILAGKVYIFEISEIFLLIVTILVAMPILMVFLSVVLPNKANRRMNFVVATFYIPYILFNLVGVAWPHMYFAAILEVGQLILILWYARKLN